MKPAFFQRCFTTDDRIFSMQRVSVDLSLHRPEMSPFIAEWMGQHDAIFLEEPLQAFISPHSANRLTGSASNLYQYCNQNALSLKRSDVTLRGWIVFNILIKIQWRIMITGSRNSVFSRFELIESSQKSHGLIY